MALALRLLAESPCRPSDLADQLACSRRTVERTLRALEAAGWAVTVRREGREAWYSVAFPGRKT